MKDFFSGIFEYHHHFNQLLAGQLAEHQDLVLEEPVKLFSHVLNAQQIWNSRILSQPAAVKIWQLHLPEAWKQLDIDNYHTTLQIIKTTDLQANIRYTNSQGSEFTNSVKDILFHANNHSTYHKGQIVSKLKALGIKPMIMDYIFYKR